MSELTIELRGPAQKSTIKRLGRQSREALEMNGSSRWASADMGGEITMINRATGLQPGAASPIGGVPDPIQRMGWR